MHSGPEPGINAHGGGVLLCVTCHRQTHTDNISHAFHEKKQDVRIVDSCADFSEHLHKNIKNINTNQIIFSS